MVTLKCCTMESTTSLQRQQSSGGRLQESLINSERFPKHPTCSHGVDTSQAWCRPHTGRHPSWGSPPGSSWPAAWWVSPWCHSRASVARRTGTGPQRLLKWENKTDSVTPNYNVTGQARWMCPQWSTAFKTTPQNYTTWYKAKSLALYNERMCQHFKCLMQHTFSWWKPCSYFCCTATSTSL